MKNWKKISDDSLRHIWKCTDEDCECDKVDCVIYPDWYQDNGTPICECGIDMEYIRTEVADTSDNDDGYAVVEIEVEMEPVNGLLDLLNDIKN